MKITPVSILKKAVPLALAITALTAREAAAQSTINYIQFTGVNFADVQAGGQAFQFFSNDELWNAVITASFNPDPPVSDSAPNLSDTNQSALPLCILIIPMVWGCFSAVASGAGRRRPSPSPFLRLAPPRNLWH